MSETLLVSFMTDKGQCDDYMNVTYTHKKTSQLVESGNVNGDTPEMGMIAKMCARCHSVLGDNVEFKINFASHKIVTNKAGDTSKSFDFIYKKKNGKFAKFGGLTVGAKVQFKANTNGGTFPEKDVQLLTIGSEAWKKAKENEPNMPQVLGQAAVAATPAPKAADINAMFNSAVTTADVIEDDMDDTDDSDMIEDDLSEVEAESIEIEDDMDDIPF
jgi:hypothetical protein